MQINQPSTRAVNVLLEVAPVAEGVFPAHDANRERERNEDEEYGDPQEYPYAADYLPHGRPAVDESSERHGSHRGTRPSFATIKTARARLCATARSMFARGR